MTRWEPDAPGRLQEAALGLFEDRGFDRTTVEDIATRAGVTKRTFFRHFADKREVLFGGGDEFRDSFVAALADAPASAGALEAVGLALVEMGRAFQGRREFARRRGLVIAANAELLERELAKLASVAAALAGTLRERGVEEPEASVAAEVGMAVFHNAFQRWVATSGDVGLDEVVRESLDALRSLR